MKILLISHFFPPTHTAGAENYALALARELHRRGHEVRVLCASKWDDGEAYLNAVRDEVFQDFFVRRVDLNWTRAADPNRALYNSVEINQSLNQWLLEWQPDLAHIISCYSLGAGVINVLKRFGVPVVLTLVDFWFLCPRVQLVRGDGGLCDGKTTSEECLHCMTYGSRVGRWAEQIPGGLKLLEKLSKLAWITRWRGLRGLAINMSDRKQVLRQTFDAVDVVVSPSKVVKQFFELNGWRKDIQIQYYGHDLSWLKDGVKKLRGDRLRFGFLGQIHSNKGVHVLVAAFRQLLETDDAELVIYGHLPETTYGRNLRTMIDSTSRIRLGGYLARSDLARAFSELDYLVVPSLWYENSPLVIQEAFAAKTPVIASRLGGMTEFVQDGENGLLFEAGNIADLVAVLQRAVREPQLLELLTANIPTVRTIENELDSIEQLYIRLIARDSKR